MTGLYIVIGLVVVALAGWGIAELKSHAVTFTHSEAEKEEADLIHKEQVESNFHEQNLKDLLAHNSTKGYNAVD